MLYLYVDQCLAQHGHNVVTNPYHSLEKIKEKADMEQESINNHQALAKTNCISKYTLSVKYYDFLNINIKDRVKNITALIF